MGTHPIFGSDFDCLTELERQKIGQAWEIPEMADNKNSSDKSGDISALIRENQQLTYENNKLLTDLNMKNMQIAALKRKVWDSDNELNQIVHERDWFRTKTKELEKALHQSKLTPSSEKRQNPFFQSP